MEGWALVQLSSDIIKGSVTIEVSPGFIDPCMFVLHMPIQLSQNVDGEGFLGLPWSPCSKAKLGLGPILAWVSKKGPYGA